MSDNINPLVKQNQENSMEEYYWDGSQMDTLQDAYLMLRDAGFTQEDIEPLGEMLDNTTIYSVKGTEFLFEEFISE